LFEERSPHAADARAAQLYLIGWIAAGLLLMLLAPIQGVQRSQEARVLATSREMIERGTLRDFLVPHLNDKPRLQKPPLAYWFTAAAFVLASPHEAAGRVPAVLAAWLTAGATFAVARRRFGDRAAAFAGAAVIGSVLMIRFGTLAETDVWTALFTTVAVGAIWRCAELLPVDARSGFPALPDHAPAATGEAETAAQAAAASRGFFLWSHVSAVAIALLALVKGPPAGYPALFLIGVSAVTGRWSLLLRWALTGAPLTALAVGVPWFVYVARTPEAHVLVDELEVIAAGGGHRRSFVRYIPDLGAALAPWTGIMLLGVVAAARRLRTDASIRIAFVWFAATFLPLCFVGQKQRHYLMPAVPPMAIAVGWMLDRALRPRGGEDETREWTDRLVTPVVTITVAVGVLAVAGLPIAGRVMRGRVEPLDVAVGSAITAGSVLILMLLARRRVAHAVTALAMLACPAVALTQLLWGPTIQTGEYRDVARLVRDEEGDTGRTFSFAFYKQYETIPLCWAMRRIVPALRTRQQISDAVASSTPPMLITTVDPPPAPPPGYVQHHRVQVEDRPVVIWAPSGSPATRPVD
jgi:4-amino-4-deoxy-L-arabinose transferase-like glycosyltransferase